MRDGAARTYRLSPHATSRSERGRHASARAQPRSEPSPRPAALLFLSHPYPLVWPLLPRSMREQRERDAQEIRALRADVGYPTDALPSRGLC